MRRGDGRVGEAGCTHLSCLLTRQPSPWTRQQCCCGGCRCRSGGVGLGEDGDLRVVGCRGVEHGGRVRGSGAEAGRGGGGSGCGRRGGRGLERVGTESTSTASSSKANGHMEPYLVTNLLPHMILQTRPLRGGLTLPQALTTRRHPQRRGSPLPNLRLALRGARRELRARPRLPRRASPRGLDGTLPRPQRLDIGPDLGRRARVGVERTQDATLDGRGTHLGWLGGECGVVYTACLISVQREQQLTARTGKVTSGDDRTMEGDDGRA